RYSAQRSSTALSQKATFVMCSSASPSTRSIESTSCCRGSLPKNCKPRSTSRTHKARREDRTLTKEHRPAIDHFLLRPLACALAIDVQHQVIVITHHCVRADLDCEDCAELTESLEHPLLSMRIVLPCVLV